MSEAVRDVLDEKETTLESDVLMRDSRLDGLLVSAYEHHSVINTFRLIRGQG